MARCMYCKNEAYAPGTIKRLCHKHMELAASIFALKLAGREISTREIRDYMELVTDPIVLQPGEVARLLKQMRRVEGRDRKKEINDAETDR